jgi:hypothetical protein
LALDENAVHDPGGRPPASRPATGRAILDLPMQWRARFETTYTDQLYVSDRLAKPYVVPAGAGLRRDHSLESQIFLARPISDTIEMGVAWGVRSPLSALKFFDFERQTFRAMVRIVH